MSFEERSRAARYQARLDADAQTELPSVQEGDLSVELSSSVSVDTAASSIPPRPPAPTELQQPRPDVQSAWIAGFYELQGRVWVWVPGTWSTPPTQDAVWVPGIEIQLGGQLITRPGSWRTSHGKRIEGKPAGPRPKVRDHRRYAQQPGQRAGDSCKAGMAAGIARLACSQNAGSAHLLAHHVHQARCMYGREISLACVILFACGTPSTPALSPSPTPAPAPEAVEQLEPPPAESVPMESVETAYESNPCEGSDLDLGSLAAQGMCNLARTAEPLPPGLVASLASDSISVVEGQQTELRLLLANTTAAPMTLELDASCWFLNVLELAVYRKGDRIDRVGSACDVNAKVDCSGHAIGVKLDAGGEAFIRVTVSAQVALLANVCKEYPGRALSPGAYAMQLRTIFADEPLRAAMTVRKLQRIARERCRSYATQVVKVAEPDPALRTEVADSLIAQCRQRPPIEEFADCRLAAETAEQLRSCGEDQ